MSKEKEILNEIYKSLNCHCHMGNVFCPKCEMRKIICSKPTLGEEREALELIADIAVDYDGYRTPEKLMKLIDELKGIANKALSKLGGER